MRTDWWDRLEALYAEAEELEGDEQAAFIERSCGDDKSLRAELERLLRSDVAIVHRVTSILPKIVDDETRLFANHGNFDRYQLLNRLDRGGMGEVFSAVRIDDESNRRIVIKILRRDWGTDPGFVRRFRREQIILARLEHPYIARLYDWGKTNDARPYISMEYVDGIPIDEYCRVYSLTIVDRLKLFQKVCDAVQFAHRNAVIHRDLKPSNILITRSGEPKLLDFGIAKFLGPEGELGVETTLLLLTPQYASPEQFRGTQVTTLTDVYSLGVILYELVAGQRPYDLTGALRREAEGIVCEHEPKKPSTTIGEGNSAYKGSSKISRLLTGDIDQIVMKAIAKSPEERYYSVDQFSQDIERHLTGHPVLARRPSFSYITQKVVRRHRLPLSLVSAAVLSLIIFVGILLVERRETRRQRNRAEAIYSFLVETFDQVAPDTARGREVTVREYLDQASRRLRAEPPEHPQLHASLLRLLGTIYTELGFYSEAEIFLSEALDLHEDKIDKESLDLAEALDGWATLKLRLGEYAEAESAYRQSLSILKNISSENLSETVNSMNSLGVSLITMRGPNAEAEELILRALELRRKTHRGDHREVISSLLTVGWLNLKKGDFGEAERYFRDAIAMGERLFQGDHPVVAEASQHLGVLLELRGRYSEAEPVQRKVVDMQSRLLGSDHLYTLSSKSDLAMTLKALGNYSEAERLMHETLTSRKNLLGPEHPDYAISLMALSTLYEDLSRYEDAEREARKAVEVWRRVFVDEPDHPTLSIALSNLGAYLMSQQKYREAEAVFQEVLPMRIQKLGRDHPDVASSLQNLGDLWSRTGEYDKARPVLERSIEIRRKHIAGHPILAHTLNSLANLEDMQKRHLAAEGLRREALEILEASFPEGHWSIEYARGLLGWSLTGQGHYEEAEELLLSCYPKLRDELGVDSTYTQKTIARIVRLYEALGSLEEADRYRSLLHSNVA